MNKEDNTEQQGETWKKYEADYGNEKYKLVKVEFYLPERLSTDDNLEKINAHLQKFITMYEDLINGDKFDKAKELLGKEDE